MSEMSIPILLSVIGAGLFVATIIGFVRWRRWQQQVATWEDFANRNDWTIRVTPGFMYSTGTLEMQGRDQGIPVSLLTEHRDFGRHWHVVTILRLPLGDVVPPGLSVKPSRMGPMMSKFFGVEDEKVGDAALDDALVLQHVTPAVRALFFKPGVKGPLLKLGRACSNFSIESGTLTVEQMDVPRTPVELEGFMSPGLGLARALRTHANRPL
ncbi:hypothetical protein [Pyxidicoccus fallax]|nr:hypothetical protein [Pyxidicoccus fallax]